jgi:hypothetical protein
MHVFVKSIILWERHISKFLQFNIFPSISISLYIHSFFSNAVRKSKKRKDGKESKCTTDADIRIDLVSCKRHVFELKGTEEDDIYTVFTGCSDDPTPSTVRLNFLPEEATKRTQKPVGGAVLNSMLDHFLFMGSHTCNDIKIIIFTYKGRRYFWARPGFAKGCTKTKHWRPLTEREARGYLDDWGLEMP